MYYRVRAGTDGNWSTNAVRPSESLVEQVSTTVTTKLPVIHLDDDTETTGVDEEPTAAAAEGEDGYTVIELKWTPDLVDNMDVAIDRPSGYEIDRRTEAGPWQKLQSDTTYTSSEYSDLDLMPGTMYTYRIFPLYSSVPAGTRSVPVYGVPAIVTTSTRMPTSSDPVRGLRVTADGPTAFNLEWDAVTETGGADIKFYVVQVVDDGDKDLVIDTAAGHEDWVEAMEPARAGPPGHH